MQRSRHHSDHHGRDPMTDWLNSRNVTTMLTGRQEGNNRRVVLAKKTIEYFLLPQQFHHLIQTGQLTDVQSNLTTTEERKILQGGLIHLPLNMESPQHHHHHHHYHHPIHREPQSMFYNAFPFLQPLMSGSERREPQISSDYSLQFQPSGLQIAAAGKLGSVLGSVHDSRSPKCSRLMLTFLRRNPNNFYPIWRKVYLYVLFLENGFYCIGAYQ